MTMVTSLAAVDGSVRGLSVVVPTAAADRRDSTCSLFLDFSTDDFGFGRLGFFTSADVTPADLSTSIWFMAHHLRCIYIYSGRLFIY
ncbi:hypothetical protein HanRHA438_Chr15g0705221 [Helianthus annuus]|nr:hypothetical protein HanIR_Chr15g0752971 [Helianthus annuus]KAJ0844685.1 hypothetical protein HanRHA438_Chr15g0705221 [Helianthus annuus]